MPLLEISLSTHLQYRTPGLGNLAKVSFAKLHPHVASQLIRFRGSSNSIAQRLGIMTCVWSPTRPINVDGDLYYVDINSILQAWAYVDRH